LETVESINNFMLLSFHGDERNASTLIQWLTTEFLNDMESLRMINHRLLTKGWSYYYVFE